MKSHFEDILVIIPAYNEEEEISSVLEGVKRFVEPDNILVIDDGSEDATPQAAARSGVCVIRQSGNRGKGEALKLGFVEALNNDKISAVITLDADGQHDPRYIPDIIEEFRSSGAEIVIAERMTGDTSTMPFIRKLTNLTTSLIISAAAGQRIGDSQSGYRLISRSVLSRIELKSNRFDMESEILIRACRKGARVSSVPIKTIYTGKEKSKINPLTDTLRFLLLVFKSFFW